MDKELLNWLQEIVLQEEWNEDELVDWADAVMADHYGPGCEEGHDRQAQYQKKRARTDSQTPDHCDPLAAPGPQVLAPGHGGPPTPFQAVKSKQCHPRA